jgi:hypothetical protein
MSEEQRQSNSQEKGTPPETAGAAAVVSAPAAPSVAVVVPPAVPSPPQPIARPVVPSGRRYGFLCTYCSSRLEAIESMAGQSGTCPTCGNSIVIPILDYRGRLIDPTSGQVIKQDPHPVHAYAAAGHKAPQIVTIAPGDGAAQAAEERFIKCPRCQRNNALSANNCLGCGLPFTMEGTVGDAVSGTNTWAVASLVLGIVGLPGFCLMVPPILAIVFGVVAMRTSNNATGQSSGQGLAIAGLVLGTLGLLGGLWFWAATLRLF